MGTLRLTEHGQVTGVWQGTVKTERHLPGSSPFVARQTVNMVMSNLSAMGSMMLPTTVCRFQRRAIQPSNKSETPA